MNHKIMLTLAFSLWATLAGRAANPAFDQWADQFAGEWARANPFYATLTQYFEGAEQDAVDRRLILDSGVKRARELARLGQRGLDGVNQFPESSLNPTQQTSAAIIRWTCEKVIREEPFAQHDFVFDQFRGLHVNLMRFLTAIHPIRNERDVDNYLARLSQVGRVIDEGIAEAKAAEENGFLPPRFIVQRVIEQLDKFLAMEPEDNPFVNTLKERLMKIETDVPASSREKFVAAAEREVRETVLPAFQRIRALMMAQMSKTKEDAGLWRLPRGDEAYAQALRTYTTTSLGAEEIHQIGLREVARLESEMDAILRELGYREGTVQERIEKLNATRQLPAEPDSREKLLNQVTAAVRDAERRSEALFDLRPKAPIIVKREPAMTEKTAAAHYTPAAPDGSQPGVYWLPLGDIGPKSDWLGIGLRTVAYHEGIPGHHFQVALQQETASLPRYRKRLLLGHNSAYVEGWALYAEQLVADNGWYKGDLPGRLGYLNGQLLRARRLVVDTGLHAKKWTRQQVIDYGMSQQETERYIMLPGQACSYMIGKLRLLELREKAKQALGDKFSIKEFHNVILSTGSVPLDVLSQVVEDWVEAQKGA